MDLKERILLVSQMIVEGQADPSFCFSWILPKFRELFGYGFHQSELQKMADAGLLIRLDSTRAGGRRYYALP